MDTVCTCGHAATDHARRSGACRGLDSYRLPCSCPGVEPDTADGDLDPPEAARDTVRQRRLD